MLTQKLTGGKSNIMKNTENILMKERKRRGLTVKQAARLLGVHHMSVYFWERGEKVPSKDNMLKIKKHFGIGASELLGI